SQTRYASATPRPVAGRGSDGRLSPVSVTFLIIPPGCRLRAGGAPGGRRLGRVDHRRRDLGAPVRLLGGEGPADRRLAEAVGGAAELHGAVVVLHVGPCAGGAARVVVGARGRGQPARGLSGASHSGSSWLGGEDRVDQFLLLVLRPEDLPEDGPQLLRQLRHGDGRGGCF